MANHEEAQSLLDLLKSLSGGEFIEGAEAKLTQLVATMKNAERNAGGTPKGKLTLTIALKLNRGMIEIDGEAKISEPSTVHGRTFMFGLDDGALVKEDPRQYGLAIAPGEVKSGIPDIGAARAGKS